MKRNLRLLSLTVTLLLVLSMVAGCNPATSGPTATVTTTDTVQTSAPPPETSAPDETASPLQFSYPLDTSPVDITMYFACRWWAGVIDDPAAWESSAIFQHIREMTGVSLKFYVPAGTEAETLGPMIATGDYPGMFAFGSLNNIYLQQMKDAGKIYNLTDLATQYAPAIFDAHLISEETVMWYKDENGDLWFLPGWINDEDTIQAYLEIEYAPTSGQNILYARKDLLKAWGKNDFATWAEFNDFLQFVHDNYPDLDAISIENTDFLNTGTAINTFARHFTSAFGCHLSVIYPNVAEQKLEYVVKDPHCIDYLKWLNGLFRKGIITESMLTETADIVSQKSAGGQYAVVNGATFNTENYINVTITANDGNTDRNYVACSQISYNDQDYFQAEMFYSKASSAVTITKNCENPDRAIRLLEYLLSEDGQVTGTLGAEGETWEWSGDERVLLPGKQEELTTNLVQYIINYKVLGCFTPFVRNRYWGIYADNFVTPTGPVRDGNNGLLGPYLTDIWHYGFCNIRTSVTGEDNLAIVSRVQEIQNNYVTKMVMAASDDAFNEHLNTLLSEAEAAGLSTLEGIWTQLYLGNCELMGITPWETLYEVKPAFEGYEITRDWE